MAEMLNEIESSERSTASVRERVIRLLSELLEAPVDRVTGDAEFRELGADSADFVELQILLLEEFDVELPDETQECFDPSSFTVDDLVFTVARGVEERQL